MFLALAHCATAIAADYADWITYEAEDGNFTLQFPVEPIIETQVLYGMDETSVRTPGSQYSIQVLRAPTPLTAALAAEWLERVEARPNLLSAQQQLLDDIPGLEVFYNESGAWIRERHYVHGQYVYTLRAAATERNAADPDATYFLDSFVLN